MILLVILGFLLLVLIWVAVEHVHQHLQYLEDEMAHDSNISYDPKSKTYYNTDVLNREELDDGTIKFSNKPATKGGRAKK